MDGFSENGNETDMVEDGNKHGGNEEEDSGNAEEDGGIKGDGMKVDVMEGDGMMEISWKKMASKEMAEALWQKLIKSKAYTNRVNWGRIFVA